MTKHHGRVYKVKRPQLHKSWVWVWRCSCGRRAAWPTWSQAMVAVNNHMRYMYTANNMHQIHIRPMQRYKDLPDQINQTVVRARWRA